MRVVWAFCAMFILVAGPLIIGAQPSGELNQEILAQPGKDITFYGATFGFGRGSPMPMNTAFPEGVGDYSYGTGAGGCGAPPPAPGDSSDCVEGFPTNELYWYTTAGFIQARRFDEVCSPSTAANACDYSKFHNERGQTKDIYFDTSTKPVGTLHMSADNHAWFGNFCGVGVCWNWDPGYYKDWAVEATVWHVNLGPWSSDPDAKPDVSPIWNDADEATKVAWGRSEPRDFWSLDPTIPHPECDGPCQTVHPFLVELDWQPEFVEAGGVVPYLNDLIVEWQWYQYDEAEDRAYIIATPVGGYVWNLNGGEDYPNNIHLPVRNPIDVELVFPRFVHDKLVILSVLNTPWGSYDVDLDSIAIKVADSRGNVVTPDADKFERFLDVSVAHSGHYDPVNLTWIWDIEDQDLPAGEYTVTVSATNFQGSAESATTATFTIDSAGKGGDVTAGQSGLLSFTNEQFQQYQEGADVDGPDSEGSDVQEAASESKGTSALGVVAVVPALLLLRRRQ